MYRSTTLLSDPWRNFIPEAPDMAIQVFAGQVTYIPLDELLVQGAVDLTSFDTPLLVNQLSPLVTHVTENEIYVANPPEEEVDPDALPEEPVVEDPPEAIAGRYTLEDKPSQRGWQLTYDVLNTKTAYGTVDKDQYKAGFLFNCTASSDNTDCINYFVTNGTQRSQLGTIMIDIIRGHDLDFTFEYFEDENLYHIKTTKYQPASLGFYWFKISWFYEGPYAEFNEYTQREEIVRGRQLFLETKWQGIGSFSNIAYIQKAESTFVRPTTDASLSGIHDPITNRPYIALNKVPNIILTYEVWPERSGYGNTPDWSISYKSEIDLNERLGAPWQVYGKRTNA